MRSASFALAIITLGTPADGHRIYAQVDTAQIQRAATDGLRIVQAAARNYPNHRDCFSCHHQTLPMLAMDLARQKGLPVDRQLLKAQAEFTWKSFESRTEALSKGSGSASMSVAYGLWALTIVTWFPLPL